MNSTVRSMIVVTCVVLGAFASARAGEIWVDQNSTAAKATGTKDAPFKTVGEAVKAAVGGDVITIRKGVYRESVQIAKGGTAEQPTILRAAPGERVVMSGFAPIEK